MEIPKNAQPAKVRALKKSRLVKRIMNRSCVNKKSFSEEAANGVVDRLAERGELIFFYKCEFCNAFHLTRRSGDVKRTINLI